MGTTCCWLFHVSIINSRQLSEMKLVLTLKKKHSLIRHCPHHRLVCAYSVKYHYYWGKRWNWREMGKICYRLFCCWLKTWALLNFAFSAQALAEKISPAPLYETLPATNERLETVMAVVLLDYNETVYLIPEWYYFLQAARVCYWFLGVGVGGADWDCICGWGPFFHTLRWLKPAAICRLRDVIIWQRYRMKNRDSDRETEKAKERKRYGMIERVMDGDTRAGNKWCSLRQRLLCEKGIVRCKPANTSTPDHARSTEIDLLGVNTNRCPCLLTHLLLSVCVHCANLIMRHQWVLLKLIKKDASAGKSKLLDVTLSITGLEDLQHGIFFFFIFFQ